MFKRGKWPVVQVPCLLFARIICDKGEQVQNYKHYSVFGCPSLIVDKCRKIAFERFDLIVYYSDLFSRASNDESLERPIESFVIWSCICMPFYRSDDLSRNVFSDSSAAWVYIEERSALPRLTIGLPSSWYVTTDLLHCQYSFVI